VTFTDGYFPFCVREVAEDGEPFEEWDQTTFFVEIDDLDFPEGNLRYASKITTGRVTVYGKHTPYPVGFTLQEMSWLYWRISKWDSGFQDMTNLTVPAITANGGHYTFINPDFTWNPDSVTSDALTLNLSSLTANSKGVSKARIYRVPQENFLFTAANVIDDSSLLVCPGTLFWKSDDTLSIDIGPPLAVKGAAGEWPHFGEIHNDVVVGQLCGVSTELTLDCRGGLGLRITDIIKIGDLYYPGFWGADLDVVEADGLSLEIFRSQAKEEGFQDGPAPGTRQEFTNTFENSSWFSRTWLPGGRIYTEEPYTPSAGVISVTLTFGPFSKTFNLGCWVDPLNPNNFTPAGSVAYLAEAKSYFTYGGIYNEDTGAPV